MTLAWPVGEPVRITQPFGYDPTYPGNSEHFHVGIDLGVVTGTEVRINAPGRVIFAGWNGGYGQCVMVEVTLPDGLWIELFGHLHDFAVYYGDAVTAGELIAHSDNTGNSTGPHLHWGVRRPSGYWEDPFAWRLAHSLPEPDPPEEDELTPEQQAALDWLVLNRGALSPYAIAAKDAGFDAAHDTGAPNGAVAKGIRRTTRWLAKVTGMVQTGNDPADALVRDLSRPEGDA